MKKIALLLLAFVSLTMIGCDDDDLPIVDDDPEPTGDETTYDLTELGDSGVSGTATFAKYTDGSTLVTLDLDGTEAGNMHPSHIHFNSAAERGDIAVDLEMVDGETGMSETFITETKAGESITYEELIDFDGYINIHESSEKLENVLAQGDIGSNVLTGESITYDLESITGQNVSGTATLHERVSGETLVILDLDNTVAELMHPAHIHEGVKGSSGPIAVSLQPVNGETGMSVTNVSAIDEDSEAEAEGEITYDDLLEYNGYINVHLSGDDLTVVATTNIGSNAD